MFNKPTLLMLFYFLTVSIISCESDPSRGSSTGLKNYPGSNGINYIFQKGQEGYNCYRIPALVRVSDNTLLAFAEGRKNSCSDTGDIDLIVKRSIDNGITWSRNIIVWDDSNNTCGNPAPIYVKQTGEVVLLMTWNNGSDSLREITSNNSIDTRRVYLTRSNNEGISWSDPEEITNDVKLSNWTWYATGPGSGIQIMKGEYKDRLVVGCDHRNQSGEAYSHTIFSDDNGYNWKLGGICPNSPTDECEVAELTNNDLMLNMRARTSFNRRKVAKSKDGGGTWDYIGFDNKLITPTVQASLHRYSFIGDEIDKNILLFSNPASTENRENMTIRVSQDDGTTWNKSILLHDGFAAYSDLENFQDNRVAILYETGLNKSDRYYGISFETIAID